MTKQFNLTRLTNVYNDAIESDDKTLAFDVRVGNGRFLFLMFLSADDEKDMLYLYMRNTRVMIRLKMYGSHRKGDFNVYITDEHQRYMVAELQLNPGNRIFDFDRFLIQLNDSIPLEVTIRQKIETLRNNRDVIRRVGIDDAEKTVLIGVKNLTKGTPQDKTLRKLYMYTEESEDVITDFIKRLKQANMTVAWTTEDQRYRVADINTIINGLQ